MLISLLLLGAMGPLDVEGVWWTRGGNAQVEVTATEDGSVKGTIIWTSGAAAVAEGDTVSEAALPQGDRLGKVLFDGYQRSEKRWADGNIYDLEGGNTYRSSLRLLDDTTLGVEGCRGPFCRTQRWSRVEENAVIRLKFQPVELSASGD